MDRGYKKALTRIEKAKANKSTELDLSNLYFKELPNELKELTYLTSLNLRYNGLHDLPNWFDNFTNLTSLDISFNGITSLPNWFGNFSNLTSLDISFNRITSLPDWFADFTNLTYLDISCNRIITLPDWFKSFTNLTYFGIHNIGIDSLPNWFANFTNLTTLDISGNKFTCLPDWFGKLTNLTTLDIDSNKITSLPDWFANFSNLKYLDISQNGITCLPNWFADFTNLTYLDISGNKFVDFPYSLRILKNLTSLYIAYTGFCTLPDWFANFSNLTHLDISCNKIVDFPDWFVDFTSLVFLDITGNEITTLPNWFTNFTNLTYLYIGKNKITTLPVWFANFTNLTTLDISENQITTIPDWIEKFSNLEILRIKNNNISKLPSSITKLKKLKTIEVHGCPLVEPPIEIAKQGVEAIFDYFNSMDAGSVKVHEAKLMIVGEPGAGKTTLRRKLINPDAEMPREEETTRGIDIDKWEYDYEKNSYTVNLWDFGGQEILHATHQFFMCERALYVLLADSLKENTDYIDWLHKIRIFAGNSPKTIVHNEKDDRRREIDMTQINKRFPGLPEPMRCNLAKTLKKDDRRIDYDNLIDKIKYQIKHLDVIGQEFPKSWIELRQKLDKKHKENNQNHIESIEYYSLCSESKINKDSAITLGRYLHDIGAILFFDKDPILRNTVILNPEWGTDAVYKVIEDTTVQNNMGKFNNNDLERIWADPIYKDKHHELLRLMMNFKICYKTPNDCYILPQLLPYQPQHKDYNWNAENNLHFEYQYTDYYLKSIMVRFIVDMYEYIEDQKTVWRNGVVLKDENNRAEIIADEKNRTIHIRVCGTTCRDLLAIIRKTFDNIHGKYEKLEVEQMVPCNCNTCTELQEPNLFMYSELKDRLKNNKKTIECKKSPYYDVDIQPLINDFTQFDKEKIARELSESFFEIEIRTLDVKSKTTASKKKEEEKKKSWWQKTCNWFSGLNNILQTVFFLLVFIPLTLVILDTLDILKISEPVAKIIDTIESWGNK